MSFTLHEIHDTNLPLYPQGQSLFLDGCHKVTKDLMQKCPYMPPSHTHEVFSSNITFGNLFQKSMVSGFLKHTFDICAWDSTHISSMVDHGAVRFLILPKYLIYTNICYLSKVTFYLSIYFVRN